MSQLRNLIGGLESEGAKLWVDGDKLRYTAPHGVMTAERLATIKQQKPELIEYLVKRDERKVVESASGSYPASFAQLRFWTLQNLNPGAAFYNVPFAFQLLGPLDTSKLRESLNAVVTRHEILRTTLQEVDGKLMQIIAPAGEMEFTFKREAVDTDHLLRAQMERPFDLGRQPGLRAALVQVSGKSMYCNSVFITLCSTKNRSSHSWTTSPGRTPPYLLVSRFIGLSQSNIESLSSGMIPVPVMAWKSG